MDFNRSYRPVVCQATGKQHILLNLVTEIRVQPTDDEELQVSKAAEEEEIFFLSVMLLHSACGGLWSRVCVYLQIQLCCFRRTINRVTPPTERDGGRPLGARRAPRGPKKEPAATLSLSTERLLLRCVRPVSPLNAERKTDVLPKECNQFTRRQLGM